MVELAIALRARRATTISIAIIMITIEREMKGRRNTKMMQRSLRSITFHGAIEKKFNIVIENLTI